MIKIAIADDQLVNRKTIKQNLADDKGIEIIFEAKNGIDFFEKLNSLNPEERPQLVLMDIDMPLMNGIEAIAIGTLKFPDIKFLVLTVFDDDDKIFKAIQAGASGYLLKDDSATQLIEAITNAIEFNGVPMSPAIARKTLQWMRNVVTNPSESVTEVSDKNEILTEREIEILKLMVDGLDYKKIAEKLFISPHTVRTHTSKIYEKLHVNSKAEAIKMAHKYKWV
ncbi:MAG: response regulator transcription factor [Ferruginibacter sp.]